ncbi:hypothetical protein [Asticcacaulis sp. YBE204]|uniref:hypothetical protein n=1 Tax=Asticcacaulis sp. YBE204 TaxID=1282363 RepID=UPI0003C40653|nr:hypothetical protein [Asticcacaulis sp. YBE204]ESQ81317.1 hypothetical protein AEYBE204_02960 [Asticcacaulis sp. YBE204]
MFLRHTLFAVAGLMLVPASAMADTVYNDAVFLYELNLKNVNVQLQGASAFADLGNIPDMCKSLNNAAFSLDKASGNLDKAESAPVDAADKTRMTKTELDTARATMKTRSGKLAAIISGNCPAKAP